MQIKISLAQLDVKLGQLDVNLQKAVAWIDKAAQQGSQIVVFPELWTSGYDLSNAALYAQSLGSGIFAELAAQASQKNLFIGGSLLEEHTGHIYNTFVLFNPDGSAPFVYRKTHLFQLMHEGDWLTPGDRLVTADLSGVKTGLAVCYDLRFPEMFRHYALEGVQLVLIPAEWPTQRIDHWNILTRARAIENQLFVAAVNRCGSGADGDYGGRSMLVGPWGELILEAGADECLLTAAIDLDEIPRARKKIDILRDRRPEIY